MTQFMLPYDLLVSLCAPKIAPNFFTTFPLSPCNRYGHLYPNQADGSDRKDDRRNLIGNRFTKIRKAFDLTREWFAQKGVVPLWSNLEKQIPQKNMEELRGQVQLKPIEDITNEVLESF